jgi:hypothetical protein
MSEDPDASAARLSPSYFFCLRQRPELVRIELQPDLAVNLLKPAGVDGNQLVADAQKTGDLDLNRLNFTVWPAHRLNGLAHILAV